MTPDKPQTARVAAVMALLARDGGLAAYNAAMLLGAPIFLYRKWRAWRGRNFYWEFDRARWDGRFPDALNARPERPNANANGPRVAVLAQGWGEVETMKPLLAALRAARPGVRLVFTVKHHEAIGAAAKISDETVAPLPFNNPLCVARWLETNRPDAVIFYERFFYTNLLRALWLRRVPFVIVHARLKRKAARGAPGVAFKKWQLRGLAALCVSAPDFEPNAAQLARDPAQIQVVGSLKFPHQKPRIAPAQAAELRAWIDTGAEGAPILAAGSTHPTEEEFVLDAWDKVRRNLGSRAPVLLLAPRKTARADEVAELLRARGLRFSRRSQPAAGPVEVLLFDTLGELSTAYGWAQGAFVGGTVAGGSHNVAEPLIWGIPTAFGPRTDDFEIEQRLCLEAGVGFRVAAPDELAAHWTQILQSPDLRAQLAAKIEALVEAQRRAFESTLQILIETVDAVTTEAAEARQSCTDILDAIE